jgi:hypothetical protein
MTSVPPPTVIPDPYAFVRAIDVVPYRVADLFLLQVVAVVAGWDQFLTLVITQFQLDFGFDSTRKVDRVGS